MPKSRPTVFLSSTAIDLPEHRKKVSTACVELGFFPDGMETWPAQDADAQTVCLGKVDQADVFLGICGHRYGWVPPGQTQSISELEYQRAVERGIPRLLFLMADDHPVLSKDVEKGSGAEKLEAFKARTQGERVRTTFSNPDQLAAPAPPHKNRPCCDVAAGVAGRGRGGRRAGCLGWPGFLRRGGG